MSDDDDMARALCRLGHIERLADAFVDSGLSIDRLRVVAINVSALCSDAVDCAPTLPDLTCLDRLHLPQPLMEAIRAELILRVGEARLPSSQVN